MTCKWLIAMVNSPGRLMQKLTWLVTPLTNHVSYKWDPILQVVFVPQVWHIAAYLRATSSNTARVHKGCGLDRMVCWDSTGCELAS